MHDLTPVESPYGKSLDGLAERLRQRAEHHRGVGDWPAQSLKDCAQSGVYRWFLPVSQGGFAWSEREQTLGYLRLAEADLTTTFVITQLMGAIRRIAGASGDSVAQEWLEPLISGDRFATVGISHLTTSRRHLSTPALSATPEGTGYRLNGIAPWVTGAPHADLLVIGAALDDQRQILAAVPAQSAGLTAGRGVELVALSASCTDQVSLNEVYVDQSQVLAGPTEHVLQAGIGTRTGGLQTSTLAVGLSLAAVRFLEDEASRREDLREPAAELRREVSSMEETLLQGSDGSGDCNAAEIRAAANRLVLRSTQAALAAAKGAGFVEGHPVGRWCREAMFFLVWSCPQPVLHAHLCELAFGR